MRGDWHGGGGGVDRGALARRRIGGCDAGFGGVGNRVTEAMENTGGWPALAWPGRGGGVSRGRVLVLRGVTACGILAGEKMGRWGVSTGV
ncbi:MAG: hypothetical protein ACK55F_20575 [Acidobacteriota bacterium]